MEQLSNLFYLSSGSTVLGEGFRVLILNKIRTLNS